jgi:Host cell surface-exposed lipoprotein
MMKWIVGGLVVLALIGAATSSGEKQTDSGQAASSESAGPVASKPDTVTQAGEEKPEPPAEPAEPELTSAQENALESAQSYVDMTGFSEKGLIEQLSSSAGEGFSKADAVFAANHVDVNWNDEAVESAQSYLDMTSFSKDGLIEQLSSSAGEGFTLAQAQYAADKVY